ncbi:hypothetical protein IFM89_001045 [Coptis chinensis]|uniref:Endonuclease/exonuclease/phosphatase domain-containing protein n=1 Tax=Coptis chinensis TaxID=261450 RepID=A0A835HEV4_9MAGN|nr:hypothetical protein IFM89_001045 [Coptis chinensis]
MSTHNPDVICIAEPLIKPPTLLPPVICGHGFLANFLHNDIPHKVGNIWVFWREGLAVSLVSLSHQQITVRVNSFLMSFVHASSSYGLRRELWQDLSQLRTNNEAWAVIGDFNIVSSVVERKGGCRPCLTAMNEFNSFIHSNALINSTTLGYKFSWCNKRWGSRRMLQKLDRMLVNQEWQQGNVGWRSKILTQKLDHNPIVMNSP